MCTPAKFLMGLSLLLAGLFAVPAYADTADKVMGTWLVPSNGSHVKFYKCGGLCGKVVKVKDPSRKDIHNPNPKLRKRSVVGVVIMSGGKKISKNQWKGRLYSTKNGGTYNGYITVVSPSKLTLQGCLGAKILGGLNCETQNWSRIK